MVRAVAGTEHSIARSLHETRRIGCASAIRTAVAVASTLTRRASPALR